MKCLFIIWKWDQDLFKQSDLLYIQFNTQSNNKLIAIKQPEPSEFDEFNYKNLFFNLDKLCQQYKEDEIIWLIHKNINNTYYSKVKAYLSQKHTTYSFGSGTSFIYYNEFLKHGLLSTYDLLHNDVIASTTSNIIKNSFYDVTWNYYYYNNKEIFGIIEELSIELIPHLLGFENDALSNDHKKNKLISKHKELLKRSSDLRGSNANVIQDLLKQNKFNLSLITFQQLSSMYKKIFTLILENQSPIY